MFNKQLFQNELLSWFNENQRNLPWRKTYSPYHIWISEIMLQQTQMERGALYFERWIKRFPDIASISKANEEEILKLWEGLGYYSRARNIKKCAAILTEEFAADLPGAAHLQPHTFVIIEGSTDGNGGQFVLPEPAQTVVDRAGTLPLAAQS